MANFVAIVDPAAERRRAFIHAVNERIALLPALTTGQMDLGAFAVTWAAGDRAPVTSFRDTEAVAVVWGDAMVDDDQHSQDGAASVRIDARRLGILWAPARSSTPPAFDGFHAALRYDTSHGLTVGGDVFGLFPLYYAAGADVTVVASSPELIALHPCFPAVLDREGLVGLLLVHACLGGRTLHRAVRRLQPGCALRSTEGRTVEVPNFRIAPSPSGFSSSFAEQVERLHGAYAAALARHAPPEVPMGVLLSGGRDSRMWCGYLGGQTHGMHALTLGRMHDYEALCAQKVARALHLQHRIVALPEACRPADAELQAGWEHLGTGFSNVHMWSALEPLRALPPRFLTGYLRESLDFAPPSPIFADLFASTYNRGFSVPQLRRLLHPSWHGVLDERLSEMHDTYERSSDEVSERPWRFQLAHYARTHPGGVPWRLSFASWPVLPILDRALLNVIASVPLSKLASRRAQDAILRKYFPSLARLPLDRNQHDTEPLLPGRLRHWLNPMIVAARERRARVALRMGRDRSEAERRYYYRVYDIDGPGWRAVREMADPYRERLADHFDMGELGRWLPAPSVTMSLSDPIQDAFRPKLLLGLMLWAATHSL